MKMQKTKHKINKFCRFKKFKLRAKKLISYLIILSLLWSNCLWATDPLQILEEDFEHVSVRTYLGDKVGVVDPGVVKDGMVHNIFDEFLLPQGSGVIFRGNPTARVIFNRFYGSDYVRLSGTVQSEISQPIVFANQEGFVLENPDFKNVPSITLVAGGIAKTNKGMGYGVDNGTINLRHALLEEENDLQQLSLVGREIQISQSLLSPQEKIDITVGQHIGVLERKEDLNHPTCFTTGEAPSIPSKNSVIIDTLSVLRSKRLQLRSLEEGATIACLGLLQSTDDDIHIQARGDIYIHRLLAAKNLHIETTGNIVFGDQVLVGGSAHIKGKNIDIEQGLSAIGRSYLQASGVLNLGGKLSCEDAFSLKGKEGINILGTIASKKQLKVKSEGEILQKGSLYSGHTLDIKGKFSRNEGTILSEGPLKIETEDNNENAEGCILSLSQSHFISKKGRIINGGEIKSEAPIFFIAQQTDNYGFLQTQEQIHTTGLFQNKRKAQVNAKSLFNPQTFFSQNKGLIKLIDSIDLNLESARLKGTIKTEGKINFIGNDLTIKGDVTAQQGANFNLKNFTNLGKLSAFETGLQGIIETLTNKGKLDLSMVKAVVKKTENKESGVIRTHSHFLLQGKDYTNKGKVFTCGVHETTLEGSYRDYGSFYSPYLFLLKAKNIELFSGQKSFLREGIMDASHNFLAGERVRFALESNVHKCFLQISSQGNLQYNGEIRQFSNSPFPLLEYFNIFKEKVGTIDELTRRIASFSFGSWKSLRKAFSSGITLRAGKDLLCQKSVIHPESGTVNLIAEGKIQTEKANIKAGYFQGNHALMKSKKAFLEDSQLISLFGTASLIADESAVLSSSHIKGRDSAFIQANFVELKHGSSVESSDGSTTIEGTQGIRLESSRVKGKSSVALKGRDVTSTLSKVRSEGLSLIRGEQGTIEGTIIKGKNTLTEFEQNLSISLSTLSGEYNRIKSKSLRACSLKTKGNTFADVTEEISLHDLQAQGVFKGSSEEISLSGNNSAQTLVLEGDHLLNKGNVEVQEHLSLRAKKLEQLGSTKSGITSTLEGTDAYIGTKDTHNEAGSSLSILAENNTQLEGQQKSALVSYKLRDANLINLLNQTEAKTTEVRLTDGSVSFDSDLVLNTNLRLWAKKLENKATLTGNGDFIAHIQTSILNKGVMDIHGKAFLKAKESITNFGDISGREGLAFETETFTHKGSASSSDGLLSVKAQSFNADSEVQTYQEAISSQSGVTISKRKARFIIPSFLGKAVHLESGSSLNVRGANIKAQQDISLQAKDDIHLEAIPYSEGDHEITIDFSQLGLPHLKLATRTDAQNKFLQGSLTAGGNIRAKTSGKLDGRGLKVNAGGHIIFEADRGVDLSSLAAVSVVERWNYNTGLFGQNNHRGYREDATFYKTELSSQNGGIFVIAKDGGITARGTAFQAHDTVRLDARDDVDIRAKKATTRYASHDEDQFLCFGSQDDKEGTTEKVRQFETLSNKKVEIFSRRERILGDLAFMRAPEMEFDGERGIFFKPLEIHSSEDTHHYENNLNPNPTNIEFEHKERHIRTGVLQQLASTFEVDFIKVRTGKGAETTLVSNISGLKGDTTDFEADTDKLTFSGIKNTYDSTTDSWSVSVSIDVDLMPGGGFEVSHDRLRKINYGATVQKFGVFHNRRQGAKLLIEGGAQTSIEEIKGEDLYVIVDHNAQDEEEQEGHSVGAKVSSSGGGGHISAKGGKKVGADTLTSLRINKTSGNVSRQDITHKEEDTRWGIGLGLQVSDKGGISGDLSVQRGDTRLGVSIPLDRQAASSQFNTQDLKSSIKTVGNINQAANNLRINTGPLGQFVEYAQQTTNIVSQTSDLISLEVEELPSLSQIEKITGVLSDTAHLSAQLGAPTDEFARTLGSLHSAVRTANNVNELEKGIEQNFRKPSATIGQEAEESVAAAVDIDQQESLSSEDELVEEKLAANVEEQSQAQLPKKIKKKKIQRKPSSQPSSSQTQEDESISDEMTAPLQDSDEKFIRQVIEQRKAQYEREGKLWGEKEEAEALKEAQKELGGVEQVTWHEDILSGGVGLVKSFVRGGLKQAGKFIARELSQAAKDGVQEAAEELVVEGAESLGADPEIARNAITAARMTTTISHVHKDKKGTHSKKKTPYKERYRTSKLKEGTPVETHSYESARNQALEALGPVDSKTRKYKRNKIGKGVGFRTRVGGTEKSYRIDYDHKKGPHINVDLGTGEPGSRPTFTFPGTEEDVSKISRGIERANQHRMGIPPHQ